MSVIHDALEKGVKSPSLAHPFPVLLPDTFPPVFRRPAFSFSRLENSRRRFFKRPFSWLLLAALVFAFGSASLIAFRMMNVPAQDSSPKTRAASTVSSRSRPGVHPARSKLSRAPMFYLTGIVEGSEPLAIINDQTVVIGDRIERALVKEIQGRRVILEFKGADIVLSLQEV